MAIWDYPVGPKCHRKCLYRRQAEGDGCEQGDGAGRSEDAGPADWSLATNAAVTEAEEARTDSSLASLDEMWPCQHLDFSPLTLT